MPRNTVPRLRPHKASGLAVVTLSGHDYYCGRYGTAEAEAEYNRLVAEWLAGGRQPLGRAGSLLTVQSLCDRYLNHFAALDRSDGHRTRVRVALGEAAALYGQTPADDFGPVRLKATRLRMVERGWARREVNCKVGIVRQAFGWAVSQQLLAETVWRALLAVRGLERGEAGVAEGKKVRPVPQRDLDRILPLLNPAARDLLRLQLLTAARPTELFRLTAADVRRDGAVDLDGVVVELGARVWAAVLEKHKTARSGHVRILLFGPAAQEILAPRLLARPPDAPLLVRQRGGPWTVEGYWLLVSRAITRHNRDHAADPVRPFSPRALRKNAADSLEREWGERVAQVVLGHADARMTRAHYLSPDLKAAAKAVEKSG